jgi:kynurenine 3-monooxygenase
MSNTHQKITIIGAGLCGSLLAIKLAQRGFKVELFEKRGDMRTEKMSAGRSINLALSSRGILALEDAGMLDAISPLCIPMTGRMVHPFGANAFQSPYSGRKGEYINSISRGELNMVLLDKAESYPNVKINFNYNCQQILIEKGIAYFKQEKTATVVEIKSDVIIGTDGAGSVLRKAMLDQTSLFNYSQQFLTHGYKELSISPLENGGFRLEKNVLHIWPRGSFMIIALPNMDGSFTVTMFHPYEGEYGFNALNDEAKVKAFFEKFYPELIPFMPDYVAEFFNNPTGGLGTIKCYPWQAYGKTLLMGDAAHAVVPFYGQGMNASFEDVRVFDELIETYNGDWTVIFEAFQKVRAENTNAIADLAIDNFYEMRDKVSDQTFVKKRNLETRLEQKYKNYFSKYSLVTFRPDIPYALAMEQGRRQDEILLKYCEENQGEVDEEKVLELLKNEI